MPVSQACAPIADINNFLASNTNIIEGKIVESLALQSPWMNVFETTTFPAHMGALLRTVIQEPIAPVLSKCNPQWGAFACRKAPNDLTYGETDYQFQLQHTWERGQPICIADAYTAVEDALRRTEQSFEQHSVEVWNDWIRSQAFNLSALKVVANSTFSFSQILSQGFATPFSPGITPDSPLSLTFILFLLDYMTQQQRAMGHMYGDGVNMHARLITDMVTIHDLRRQANVALLAGVTGGYRDKYDDAYGYMWDNQFQGFAAGADQTILRAETVNANGTINCLEPLIGQATTRGTKAIFSSAWVTAQYQVSFLIFESAFERKVPDTNYTGNESARFDKQFWGGQVHWVNNKDNICNILGDTGYHVAVYAAALKPIRPQFVLPILHLRCKDSLGLVPCTPQTYYAASM